MNHIWSRFLPRATLRVPGKIDLPVQRATRGSIDGPGSQCTITTTVVTKLIGNKMTNLHSCHIENCRHERLQWHRQTGWLRIGTIAKFTRLTKRMVSTAINIRGHGGRVLAHTSISLWFIEPYDSTTRLTYLKKWAQAPITDDHSGHSAMLCIPIFIH